MKELRRHLDALRSQHQSLRYPGNLADDVLNRPMRSLKPVWRLGGLLAIAAVITVALTVWSWEPGATVQGPQVAEVVPEQPPAPDLDAVASAGSSAEPTVETADLYPTAIAADTDRMMPTWSGVGSVPSFSALSAPAMPYQDLSVPTVSEIHSVIEAEREAAGEASNNT